MFEDYRREMERVGTSADQVNRILAAVERKPIGHAKKGPWRTVLLAAAICVLLACTTVAGYQMGVFDFLRQKEEYQFLGQTELYEQYAKPVVLSTTAENGDTLTVERVAMDGKFCTVFYTVTFHQPIDELKEIKGEYTKLWAGKWEPEFTLYAGEEVISVRAYQNSFEPQRYVADANTLYGAWRVLMSRPVADGEEVRLRAVTYEERVSSMVAPQIKWDCDIAFTASPIPAEHITPGVKFQTMLQGQNCQVEIAALDRSAMGAILTLKREKVKNDAFGPKFALRDGDTGEYISYAEVVTNHVGEPEGYTYNTYELFGDVSKLKNLELIPVISSRSIRQTVALEDLPAVWPGNQDGGFAPTTYEALDGTLIVTMSPMGATTWEYAWMANGVSFLDAECNELFSEMSVKKWKNRSNGTITVVTTPSQASFQKDVGKVAQIGWFAGQYELQPERTVYIRF